MKRFGFGSNWESYSRSALSDARVVQARMSFQSLLLGVDLADRSFLDIGFGQGLSAAIAAEAGAGVVAVDIDADCHTAYQITRRFFRWLSEPEIIIGSILDPRIVDNMRSKGPFDVVHSWGVLHHTGDMWRAIDDAASLVKPGGHLVIAIYARHWTAPLWKIIKWAYVHAPSVVRSAMIAAFTPVMRWRARQLGSNRVIVRGMEFQHDLVDGIGGYPYECASREQIEGHLTSRGLTALRFNPTTGMTGCHEYVFQRSAPGLVAR